VFLCCCLNNICSVTSPKQVVNIGQICTLHTIFFCSIYCYDICFTIYPFHLLFIAKSTKGRHNSSSPKQYFIPTCVENISCIKLSCLILESQIWKQNTIRDPISQYGAITMFEGKRLQREILRKQIQFSCCCIVLESQYFQAKGNM
jgi:hypothetical protein